MFVLIASKACRVYLPCLSAVSICRRHLVSTDWTWKFYFKQSMILWEASGPAHP